MTLSIPNFATRLYEQLAPFQSLGDPTVLWALCDSIGAMFQAVEDLTTVREDGLPGWANLVDVNACPTENLDYLAQYVGLAPEDLVNLTDAQMRQIIANS